MRFSYFAASVLLVLSGSPFAANASTPSLKKGTEEYKKVRYSSVFSIYYLQLAVMTVISHDQMLMLSSLSKWYL
jgi:hypothetical protein